MAVDNAASLVIETAVLVDKPADVRSPEEKLC